MQGSFFKAHIEVPNRRYIMRKFTAALLIAASLLVAACNTVKGVGEDIESVGEAGDRAI